MNFTQHPTNNRVLGAPPNWNQGEIYCAALPVTRVDQGDRTMLYSYWRPTDDELRALAAGGLVQLCIYSTAHPPVSLAVESI